MADPKYANLVGIAYDQPDIYETKDLPEADQNAEIFEEESDSIERLHISATTALSRFKGKGIDAASVDFSDRLGRRARHGYIVSSGDWELAGEGEKETPIQKYQRLQCEMKELLEEVAEIKEAAKEESSEQPPSTLQKHMEVLKKQLTDLMLEEKLGSELVNSLSDPQGTQLKKLMGQLAQLEGKPPTAQGGAGEGGNPTVRFNMLVHPGHSQLTQTTRLAGLEQRLARLEQAIGASRANLSRLGGGGGERSLLETAQYLSSRAALLDSAQLDSAESRLGLLLSRLDQLAEKTAAITGSSDPERDKKINELYELTKKTEHLAQILPNIIDRLQALQNLHKQGGEFAKTVSELESAQVRLAQDTKTTQEMLATVEKGLLTNATFVKADLESLDSRVKALTGKK